jgi:hypothetical protein
LREVPMFRTFALAAALFGLHAVAHADVYRWVDAQGHVQFSDRWVPGSELVKVDRNKQNAETAVARQKVEQSKLATSNTAVADREAQAKAAQTVQQDLAKNRAEDCKQAMERYDKAIKARRIFKAKPDGTKDYVSDAEADAYRAQALMDKNTACGAQAK